MTATLEAPSLPAPPLVQCPACKNVLPHAAKCRLCQHDMPDIPFCTSCRTWTAPIDKSTCIVATEDKTTGAKTYAVRGCPVCRSMPPDSFLANVGLLMTQWATEVNRLRPKAPPMPATEVTAQPAADLAIRVTTTQSGFIVNEIVEYDLIGSGQGNVPVVLTNRVRGDTPLGKFLKDVAHRYAAMKEQLETAQTNLDTATRERDELRAALEQPEKKKGK